MLRFYPVYVGILELIRVFIPSLRHMVISQLMHRPSAKGDCGPSA